MVTCRSCLIGSIISVVGILSPARCAHAAPPQLLVKQPTRVEFPGKPGIVFFDTKGKTLIAGAEGAVRQWTWPGLRPLKGWDGDPAKGQSRPEDLISDPAAKDVLHAWDLNRTKPTVLESDEDAELIQLLKVSPSCWVGKKRKGECYLAGPSGSKWRPVPFRGRDAELHDELVWGLSDDGKTLAGWGPFFDDSTPARPASELPELLDPFNTALYLWNVADGKILHKVSIRDPGIEGLVPFEAQSRIVFSPDGKTVVLHTSHTLHVIEATSGKRLQQFGTVGKVDRVPSFSPDGKLVAVATDKEYVLVYHVSTGSILAQIRGPKRKRPDVGDEDPIGAVAFGRDGKTLAVGRDGEILLFPIELEREPPRVALSDAECAKLWDDLGGDAKRAIRAMRILDSHADEAVRLLKARLKPIEPADPARVKKLLLDLEAPQFAIRRDAFKALAELADLAGPALAERLKEKPSLDAKRRIDDLLSRLSDARGFTPWLRDLRAIEVLERVNTAEAREVLAALGKGAAGHRVTEQAREALRRMRAGQRAPVKAEERAARDKSLPPHALARLGSLHFRHAGNVRALSYAADGKTIVTADGGYVRLWDTATGKEKLRISAYTQVVSNGRTAVFTTNEGIVFLDPATGKTRLVPAKKLTDAREPHALPDCAGISTDGTRLCLHFDGNTITRIWDVQAERFVRGIDWRAMFGPRMSPDAATILMTTDEPAAVLYSLKDGQRLRQISDAPSGEAVFSPDSKMVALFRAITFSLRCVDAATGKTLLELGSDVMALGAAFSPDSSVLAVSFVDRVELWNPRTGKKTASVPVSCASGPLAFSPDGRTVAVASQQAVTFIDLASGKERGPDAGHTHMVAAMSFSPDGRFLASLPASGRALLWDTRGRLLRDFPYQITIHEMHFGLGPSRMGGDGVETDALGFDEGGRRLCAANQESSYCWDVETRKKDGWPAAGERADLLGATPGTQPAALFTGRLFPWGPLVARADWQTGTVDVRDVETGNRRRELAWPLPKPKQDEPPPFMPPVLGFSPDGKTLAGFGWDDKNQPTLWLWETASGQRRAAYRIPALIHPNGPGGGCLPFGPGPAFFHQISTIRFSPDGRTIVLENLGNIYLWDLREERIIRHLFGSSPTFSPDGKLLAARTPQGVRLFDLVTGRILYDFGDGRETCLAISPDSRTLATGRMDTTILLWDIARLVESNGRVTPTNPPP
jgi:WD40 repeat protein